MKNKIVASLLLGTALSLASAGFALAQDKTVKIGALSDQSGLYADLGGPGSTLAAQMAVEDSGLTAKGWKIDIISGDHQNKPDVGTAIARQWFDVDKVDVIVDVPNSGVALAVNNVIKEKNGVYINSGAATSDLTNAQCSPNTVHWTYDTYMLAHTTGQALVKAGLSVVANLSDIITVLTRGHVLAEGNYADLSRDERVKEAYLGAGHA